MAMVGLLTRQAALTVSVALLLIAPGKARVWCCSCVLLERMLHARGSWRILVNEVVKEVAKEVVHAKVAADNDLNPRSRALLLH